MLRKVQGNRAYSTRMKKVGKIRKKRLTIGAGCVRIAKLSQREGAKETAESRPREGKELAEESAGAKRERKNLEKR